MILVRWVSFILASECVILLIVTPRGAASAALAAIFFVFFLVLCWSLGAFAKTATHTVSRKATKP